MSDPAQELQDAERAKALLADPLLQRTFDDLSQKYFQAWKDSEPKETDSRELLWQLFWALEEVRRHLSVMMQRGTFHRSHLEKIKKRQRS